MTDDRDWPDMDGWDFIDSLIYGAKWAVLAVLATFFLSVLAGYLWVRL